MELALDNHATLSKIRSLKLRFFHLEFFRLAIFRLVIALVMAIALTAPLYTVFSFTPAYSQVKKPKPRQNIFDMLFGKRGSLNSRAGQKKALRIKLGIKLGVGKVRSRRTPVPATITVEKNQGAAKILVAGDFMAGALAWGLAQAFADNPNVIIVDISKGLSGFVRDDVKDWPGTIAAHIDEIKPTAIVFLGGMNDRQQMALGTGRVEKLGEAWLEIYNQRTQRLARTINDKKLPLIWSGLPPVRSGRMSTDYLVFNEIYRTQAQAVGGAYVDVWHGFTNAEGQFVSAGPNINGQIKRLRTSDGINMNKTGKRKLAFYVNKAIRKLTGIGTQNLLVSLPGINDLRPVSSQYDPAKTGKTIIYSLASPTMDGGSELAGLKFDVEEKVAKRSVSYKLVIDGKLPRTHKGRVDHYGVVANEVVADAIEFDANRIANKETSGWSLLNNSGQ